MGLCFYIFSSNVVMLRWPIEFNLQLITTLIRLKIHQTLRENILEQWKQSSNVVDLTHLKSILAEKPVNWIYKEKSNFHFYSTAREHTSHHVTRLRHSRHLEGYLPIHTSSVSTSINHHATYNTSLITITTLPPKALSP